MNIYEAQDFFKNMYPEKKITFDFDLKCIRQIEIIQTDGFPNLLHNIEYQKLKVSIEGMEDLYVPILPHRMGIQWDVLKKHVNSLPEPKNIQ